MSMITCEVTFRSSNASLHFVTGNPIGSLLPPRSRRLRVSTRSPHHHTTPASPPHQPATHCRPNLIGPEACRRHRGVAVLNANCCKAYVNPTLSVYCVSIVTVPRTRQLKMSVQQASK